MRNFRIIEDADMNETDDKIWAGSASVQFHLFPSKVAKTTCEYVKFLIRIQKNVNLKRVFIIDDFGDGGDLQR